MDKYMVVYFVKGYEDIDFDGNKITIPEEKGVFFTNDMAKAEQFRMDTECGLGGYAEVYHRVGRKGNRRYELLYC